MILWWSFACPCLKNLVVQPKESELSSAFIKRDTSPTNHVDNVICLIQLQLTNNNKPKIKFQIHYCTGLPKTVTTSRTSWNMQSRIVYDCPDPAPFFRDPLGKAEGNRCNNEPFLSLLIVVPFKETTKHRFPEGLANTYLQLYNYSPFKFLKI